MYKQREKLETITGEYVGVPSFQPWKNSDKGQTINFKLKTPGGTFPAQVWDFKDEQTGKWGENTILFANVLKGGEELTVGVKSINVHHQFTINGKISSEVAQEFKPSEVSKNPW